MVRSDPLVLLAPLRPLIVVRFFIKQQVPLGYGDELRELIVGALPDMGDEEVLALVMSTAG